MKEIEFSVAPYSNDQVLADWLRNLGYFPQKTTDLTRSKQRFCLLGYHPVEVALQAAMQQGELPEQALAQWVAQVRELLAQFKADRTHTTLINLVDLEHAPEQAAAGLAKRWGVSLEEEPPAKPLPLPSQALSSQPGSQHGFCQLLAKEMVGQSEELPGLLAELDACTLPLAEQAAGSESIAADAAFQQWRAEFTQQQNTAEENRLLLEQLHRLQEKQESTLSREKALARQHEERTQEIITLQRQLDEQAAEGLGQRLAKQEEESHLLLEQLHLVQEELESALGREKTLTQQHEQAAKQHQQAIEQERAKENKQASEAQQLEQKLQTQRQEHEQTAEGLGQRLAEQEEESQLLLEQLHLVQEELERQILQGVEQRRQFEESQAEQQAAKREQVLGLAAALQKSRRSKGRQASKRLQGEYQLIKASGLFDQEWYRQRYPDIANAQIDPLLHYLKDGAGEGRNPGPGFDTTYYLLAYQDVAESGQNPLVHYIRFGRAEQRQPQPNERALPAGGENA